MTFVEHSPTSIYLRHVSMLPSGVEFNLQVLTANGDISSERLNGAKQPGAIALDCEMVGGGRDGSANICARVCIVDEHENVLLNTYVQPILPITDFR